MLEAKAQQLRYVFSAGLPPQKVRGYGLAFDGWAIRVTKAFINFTIR